MTPELFGSQVISTQVMTPSVWRGSNESNGKAASLQCPVREDSVWLEGKCRLCPYPHGSYILVEQKMIITKFKWHLHVLARLILTTTPEVGTIISLFQRMRKQI